MATEHTELTLLRVWRDMAPEQRARVAQAFWLDGDSMPQQVEAVTFLARLLRFRPQSVLNLPVDRRTRQLAQAHRPPDSVIGRALVAYHLAEQRPMLVTFLDHLGVPHEDGLITDSASGAPAAERLTGAVEALAQAYPVQDVVLYLRTLAVQDPETWGGLAPVIAELSAAGL